MNAGDAKPMERLERALQASLRPVDPGAEFTAAVQARLAAASLRPLVHPAAVPASRARWLHPLSLALAASIVVAVAVGWQLQELRLLRHAEQVRLEQVRVKTQLLVALEITSERLGQVQRRLEQYQLQEKSL
jgi:hypothetical protein